MQMRERTKTVGSSFQMAYLQTKKRERKEVVLLRALILAGFLILWEIAADYGWIDPFIFSSPVRVGKTFVTLWKEQGLLRHIGITVYETGISFFLVSVFGMVFAILLWLFPRFCAVTEPYLVVLNSLPKSALAPLLIVWMGANVKTIITAGISVAIFGSVISIYSSFKSVEPDMLRLIATLGGTRKDMLFYVVIPWSLPGLLAVWKVNIGLCLVGVVIGEFIGAREGLGYLIIYGSQVFGFAHTGKKRRGKTMIAIVCLEERMGMQFAGRRLSRDRVVTENISKMCNGKTLWLHPASAGLFAEEEKDGMVILHPAPDFLDLAGEGEYCFVEQPGLHQVEEQIEQLVIFWWNRRYPSDRKFDLELSKWEKISVEEFAGYSHENITKEVYRKREFW